MKLLYSSLAAAACVTLGFCIAAAMSAQALDTWWSIKSTNATDNAYYFGLYRVCVANATNAERCYTFDNKDIQKFKGDQLATLFAAIDVDNRQSRDVWIISFIAIIFTGIAFIVSVPTLTLSCGDGEVYDIVPKLQCLFTLVGTALGITSVCYSYNQAAVMWESGVKALRSQGLVTDEVAFHGVGFVMQVLYPVVEVIPCVIYAYLVKIHPKSKSVDEA